MDKILRPVCEELIKDTFWKRKGNFRTIDILR